MVRKILILFLLLTVPVNAYPQSELGTILNEKYPGSVINGEIILKDDGNGVYIAYSSLPIPDEYEMETLWLQIVAKRQIEAQNKIEEDSNTNAVRNQYDQAITDLDIIKTNDNPTNAQMVWAIKRMAEIESNLLKWLRWFYT